MEQNCDKTRNRVQYQLAAMSSQGMYTYFLVSPLKLHEFFSIKHTKASVTQIKATIKSNSTLINGEDSIVSCNFIEEPTCCGHRFRRVKHYPEKMYLHNSTNYGKQRLTYDKHVQNMDTVAHGLEIRSCRNAINTF